MRQSVRIIELLGRRGVASHRELVEAGARGFAIKRLVDRGVLAPVRGHGADLVLGYRLASAPPGEEAEAAKIRMATIGACHPGVVLFGLAALQFHDLTDETDQHWLAATGPDPSRNRHTRLPDLKIGLWSRPGMLETGVEERRLCGVRVRVTDPCRSVLDAFTCRTVWDKDRTPRPVRMNEHCAYEALKTLVVRKGEGRAALRRIGDYAAALGCAEAMTPILAAMQHTLDALGRRERTAPASGRAPREAAEEDDAEAQLSLLK